MDSHSSAEDRDQKGRVIRFPGHVRTKVSKKRTDTEILDELADVARRSDPDRLADHLEHGGPSQRGEIGGTDGPEHGTTH